MAGDVRSIYTVKDGKMVEVISDAPATADKRGMVKPDGVTTSVDANGGITALGSTPPDAATIVAKDGKLVVKDIAIGGDAGDLASARGQIGNPVFEDEEGVDFDETWKDTRKISLGMIALNGASNIPPGGSKNPFYLNTSRLFAGGAFQFGAIINREFSALLYRVVNSSILGSWKTLLAAHMIGDGIRANGEGGSLKISVPEYDGATSSDPGTAGLVPPAEAGAGNRFLSPYGDWRYGTTREVLTSTKTLYVRTDGDDANDGSADDAAHAFKTVNAAVAYASARFQVFSELVIKVGQGTFTEVVRCRSYMATFGKIVIRGSGKDSTIIERASRTLASFAYSAVYSFEDVTLRVTRTEDSYLQAIVIPTGVFVTFKNVGFSAVDNSTSSQPLYIVSADNAGAGVSLQGDCSFAVTGSNDKKCAICLSSSAGYIAVSGTVSVEGILLYFAYVRNNGYISSAATYSGSATGTRYKVEYGMINVGGRGPDYLPGDTGGIIGTQGVYA